MTCVALFTISSFLCGLAPNLGMLIFFRVLQGVGGGGLQPSEQAILADTFPPAKRGMAFAIYGMAVVLAPAIGPTLGGWITDNYELALDLLHQRPGRPALALPDATASSRIRRGCAPAGAPSRSTTSASSLIVVGLGALQVVLDKGQRDDWFASPFITAMAVVTVVAIVVLVLWELKHDHPIVELRLLANRNLAIACFMMLALGIILFGSIVILPQYLQTVMGYSAVNAGMVLSPGGLVVILLLPFVGRLLGKVDGRWLVAFGFAASAAALFVMTNIYPGISFGTAVRYRIYQSIGLAFLFIPITTFAYVGVPAGKNNQVSALTNLMRNLGGGIGISVAQTLVARRAQFHQQHLVSNITAYSSSLRGTLGGLGQMLAHHGAMTMAATRRAYAVVYGMVQAQATTLAFIDTLWLLGIGCALVTPLAFAMKKPEEGATPQMH